MHKGLSTGVRLFPHAWSDCYPSTLQEFEGTVQVNLKEGDRWNLRRPIDLQNESHYSDDGIGSACQMEYTIEVGSIRRFILVVAHIVTSRGGGRVILLGLEFRKLRLELLVHRSPRHDRCV